MLHYVNKFVNKNSLLKVTLQTTHKLQTIFCGPKRRHYIHFGSQFSSLKLAPAKRKQTSHVHLYMPPKDLNINRLLIQRPSYCVTKVWGFIYKGYIAVEGLKAWYDEKVDEWASHILRLDIPPTLALSLTRIHSQNKHFSQHFWQWSPWLYHKIIIITANPTMVWSTPPGWTSIHFFSRVGKRGSLLALWLSFNR